MQRGECARGQWGVLGGGLLGGGVQLYVCTICARLASGHMHALVMDGGGRGTPPSHGCFWAVRRGRGM